MRYYTQSGADFYNHSFVNGSVPAYTSADTRLADMDSVTFGVKYGRKIGTDSEFSVRLEQMVQSGEDHPADAIGIQQQLDLFPELEATTFQFTYSTTF